MWLDVEFGSSQTGLGAAVTYRFYTATGLTGSAVNTNVIEIGGGAYGVNAANLASNIIGIEWHNGSGLYAHEDFSTKKIEESVFNRRNWDKGTGTVTIYQEDKTTAKYTFSANSDLSDITP